MDLPGITVNGINGFHTNGHLDPPMATPTGIVRPVTACSPRRRLKIATVGAGFSGLIFAHKLQHQYPEFQDMITHQILEARDDIGGTWLVNRYPGVQCDVPAHIYAFPFEPNPNWSHFYATGQEIFDYIKSTAKKYNLDRDVKLRHQLIEAIWQEESGQWRITVENPEGTYIDHVDFLVSGQGVLNSWKWPEIKNLQSFKGHKCHSAAWDESYDYSGKTLAVIGNGSSGVQIIPKLAALPCTNIISFQRSPNYVYTHLAPASLLGREDPDPNPAYTEEDITRFRENKKFHRDYRRKMIQQINSAFKMFVKDSPPNRAITELARKQMEKKLQYNPDLCSKLIPEWSLGCRRITPGEGYLESLLLPNVQVKNSVTQITEDSVITADGESFEVDVIACATGFDVSFKPQWRMIGRGGVDLGEQWEKDPDSYLALAARHMPNYFMFLGPRAVVGHGSLIEAINWTADYLLKWIRKVATEDIKSIMPKTEAVDELTQYQDELHKKMIWTENCKSWFKGNRPDGSVAALFAGSALLYKQLVSEVRAEDWEIEYWKKNRWEFLGNGFTAHELVQGNDLAWYIEN